MRKLVALTVVLSALVLGVVPAVASAQNVRMGKGQTLRIGATESPSQGTSWELTGKPKRAILARRRGKTVTLGPTKDDDGNPIVGVPERRYFYWKAVGRGTTTIVIKLTGPTGKKIRTRRYTITVR